MKVGDLVSVISRHSYYRGLVGVIGEVVDSGGDVWCYVEETWFKESELALEDE